MKSRLPKSLTDHKISRNNSVAGNPTKKEKRAVEAALKDQVHE